MNDNLPGLDKDYLKSMTLDQLRDLKRGSERSLGNIRAFIKQVDAMIETRIMEGQPTLFEENDQ